MKLHETYIGTAAAAAAAAAAQAVAAAAARPWCALMWPASVRDASK